MKPIDKLKNYYIQIVNAKTISEGLNVESRYNILRCFCIECELLTFNEIELMEFEVNNLFS
jgi:hypothetical protein